MKSMTFEAVAETAYEKKLAKPLNYNGTYTAYESIDEIKAAADLLSDDEVIKFRNAQRKNNARAQALQNALDAAGVIKPTIENDYELRLRKMTELFVANGVAEKEARAKAVKALAQ